MSQIAQNALVGPAQPAAEDVVSRVVQKTSGGRPILLVNASDYLRSDIVAEVLPDTILDRLADLHWSEQEPAMAI